MSRIKLDDIFELLRTASSEVSKKNLFASGRTVHIPDFFLIFFCLSLFCFGLSSDMLILYVMILQSSLTATSIFVVTMLLHTICELFIIKNEYGSLGIPSKLIQVISFILGFGPIIMCVKILKENFETQKNTVRRKWRFPHQFFSIKNESLYVLKISCCVYLAVKCIPQLLVVCLFILNGDITGRSRFVIVSNILINTLIFSLTIAITFPIRKTPRVFTSSTCIVFNALNKFLATMCACCIHLAIFSMAFKKLKYSVLVVNLIKSLIWVWPCWRVLKFQPKLLSTLHFFVYLTFISLVFGFIYIHPFEGQGKLYYYFFYLVSFMFEIMVTYMCCPETKEISYYYTLKILMFGFLSCYGLLNILHKYQDNECETPTILEVPQREEILGEEKARTNQTKVKTARFDSKNIHSMSRKESEENSTTKTENSLDIEPKNSASVNKTASR